MICTKGVLNSQKRYILWLLQKNGSIYNAQLYLYLTIFTYHPTPVIGTVQNVLELELPFNNLDNDLEFKNTIFNLNTGAHVNATILKQLWSAKITNLFNLGQMEIDPDKYFYR